MLCDPLARIQSPPEFTGDDEPGIGEAGSSLEFLRAVYGDSRQPMTRRMRAAIAALPFEHPKLAVTATINGDGFAAKLEAAIAKTAEMRVGQVIEGGATGEHGPGQSEAW